ncbi:SPASM domain-containing protein [Caulobacter sp. LjRoot300]|uniref:SPASM domain-containing protein n=1 Tax=Caulobacter sp. LjRoot300 TaxID=3342321 RepID=UPI003ECFFABE
MEGGVSVHADGNVTCGLDDPYSRRTFGNVNRQTVSEVWANPEYERMQSRLWDGWRCAECNLSQAVDASEDGPMPARALLPTTLVAEATIRCNLRCPQIACVPNNHRDVRTRDSDFLNLDTFRRTIDEIGSGLTHVFFFNYGDPFVNVEADAMLTHLGQVAPQAWGLTSTNGIPLSKMERARTVVASGALDRMIFTIGGATQESYERYHVGGRLDLALKGMANVVQAKRELGVDKPTVVWRYLTFNWNDGDEEIAEAVRLSEEIGVDEFRFHLTHVPLEGVSWRFSRGGPNFRRYRRHIDNAFGFTHFTVEPDEDGFYQREELEFGTARWTGWQARRRLPVRDGRATIEVSTTRPGAEGRDHVFVLTPWAKVKVALRPGRWSKVELAVADPTLRMLEVELVTFDHWFPAEECGTDDRRCLGVLVREQDETVHRRIPWPRLRHPALDGGDEARLAGFRYQPPEPLIDW